MKWIKGVILGNENTTRLLNLLKSSDELYYPLSKKEERAMIEKYRNDRDKLNQLLVMHNLRMVFKFAAKYKSKTDDFDGLVQDGILGLAEAAKRFDIDKDVKFITYAYSYILKYLTCNFYGNEADLDKHSISLNSISIDDSKTNNGLKTELEDYVNEKIEPTVALKSIDDELHASELTQLCDQLMNTLKNDTTLSSTDIAIFEDIFYNKEKTKEIAFKYKTTTDKVKSVKNYVLNKFKNILASDYDITDYSQVG